MERKGVLYKCCIKDYNTIILTRLGGKISKGKKNKKGIWLETRHKENTQHLETIPEEKDIKEVDT